MDRPFQLTDISPDSSVLIVACRVPARPEQVYAAWTTPEIVTRWWPTVASIDLRVGGSYHFHWPAIGQHLRGIYQIVESGQRLRFTWRWDDDEAEGVAERWVEIRCEAHAEGETRLLLMHGPYAETVEDQQIRSEHHLAGWQHFLPRLVQVV